MPATEQTWRDSKLLHVVFGVSSLIMLISTIWMLTADHQREWKKFQRRMRDVESGTIQARISQQNNDDYRRELQERQAALAKARHEVPSTELLDAFQQKLDEDADARQEPPPDFSGVMATYDALIEAKKKQAGADKKEKAGNTSDVGATDVSTSDESALNDSALNDDVTRLREKLVRQLEQYVANAKFREDFLLQKKKFGAAHFDVERSQYEIGVGNDLPVTELNTIEQRVEKARDEVEELTKSAQDAKSRRLAMERVLNKITADEAKARKALDEQRDKLVQLEKAYYERRDDAAKEILAMPIIDAFGRPLKVEQIWLPKLTINNNFSDVARFDRCTTCHQGLDKTAPGSAVEAAYRPISEVPIALTTPKEQPQVEENKNDTPAVRDERLLGAYHGMHLAERGLLDADDVTVSVVVPESAAAKAGLMVGDVLRQIEGVKVLGKNIAYRYLVESVTWGKPIKIKVERGLPNPYISHPRLDLFVGSLSPHKMMDVGCTICHEGQGSATDFKWASHSPSSHMQGTKWKNDYGWFNNHHWIFPMNPKRFAESSCLKCHHDVVELEPSERFPDPPAPKLLAGYDLIRQYGCYGCHEINGYDGPNKRIGPDLRVEPNYSAAAQGLLAGGDLKGEQDSLAHEVAMHPDNDGARHALLESLRTPTDAAATPPAAVQKLATVLEDVEAPGKLRKVGPSLRHVASKLDFDFLYSWIRRPKDFRPDTKMPQFFGLWSHLDGPGLKDSKRFEPVEIRGAVAYLLTKSQPFEYADKPAGVKAEPSAERGKQLFETRGCLACHQQSDFPKADQRQGPNLSNIGAKLGRQANRNGRRWLYSWLRNPSNYHPRTLMPNLLLEPLEGESGKTDPAADIAAYLLAAQDWQPTDVPSSELSNEERAALGDLTLTYLKDVFGKTLATRYVASGIPEDRRDEVKGDEVELIGPMSPEKQLVYIGRRTISKYGCSGCHDVPGFEDVKPIGTGLADWGRKSADKLAFEQITQYLTRGHGLKSLGEKPIDTHDASYSGGEGTEQIRQQEVLVEHGEDAHAINFDDFPPGRGFFLEKLFGHEREGFIWQKLRQPRSYDYKKTENKGYNERLRMPQFNIDEEQIEQVVTFVLGLLAEPPAQQYVYRAQPRRQAIGAGLKVVEKFNCKGCHAFAMDKWQLAYAANQFGEPSQIEDYPFLIPHFTPQEMKASQVKDPRGLLRANITGLPNVDEKTGLPLRVDEDGAPIDADDADSAAYYNFVLWKNVLINGLPRQAGLQNLLVPEPSVTARYPAEGGTLGQLIYANVLAEERKANPNAKADEAWGWLPPPLVGEGRKVQSNWLHDFLLDPYPIRPAVVLRMPKFNMSSTEASALASYFAAVDNADYPYDFDPRRREGYLQAQEREEQHPDRLADALKIVTDNNYCVKCHLIGDFVPAGSKRAMGPHLDQVYRRLRPDFVLDWIANPKRILPYTGMPVNVPFNKPVAASLYHGNSQQQLEALVDLLMNYDRFTESRTSIKPMVKPAAPAAAGAANQPAAPPPAAGAARPAPGTRASTAGATLPRQSFQEVSR